MKKIAITVLGVTILGLSGCLIGADPFTYKNDADPNATVQPCLGGMAESSNGLCWWHANSMGIPFGEVDKSTICDSSDEIGGWRLPSYQEYIRLLGNCRDASNSYMDEDNLIYCDDCGESPICSQVFPDLEDPNYYYLTSEDYRVSMRSGLFVDDSKLEPESNVNIMCVRPEAI